MSWPDRRIVVESFDRFWEGWFLCEEFGKGYSQKMLHGIQEQALDRGVRFLVYDLLLVMTLKT